MQRLNLPSKHTESNKTLALYPSPKTKTKLELYFKPTSKNDFSKLFYWKNKLMAIVEIVKNQIMYTQIT